MTQLRAARLHDSTVPLSSSLAPRSVSNGPGEGRGLAPNAVD